MSERENHSFCNLASYFEIFTEARAGKLPQLKPMSAWGRSRTELLGAQRNNYQVARLHAGSHRRAQRTRRVPPAACAARVPKPCSLRCRLRCPPDRSSRRAMLSRAASTAADALHAVTVNAAGLPPPGRRCRAAGPSAAATAGPSPPPGRRRCIE